MSNFYRHIIGSFTAAVLWTPLLLWVTALAGRYPAQTPLISMIWWELALSMTLIVLPALAMRAYQLAPAHEHHDPQG
jgi:hypothetical protein